MNMDGNSLNGNWESGISFIDNIRLGTPTDAIAPDHLAKNKAKNHYYFLPLILGLIGMFSLYNKTKTLLLFYYSSFLLVS